MRGTPLIGITDRFVGGIVGVIVTHALAVVLTAIHIRSAGGFFVAPARSAGAMLTVITDVCRYGGSIRRIDATPTTIFGIRLIIGARSGGAGLGTTNPGTLTLIAAGAAVGVIRRSNPATAPT